MKHLKLYIIALIFPITILSQKNVKVLKPIGKHKKSFIKTTDKTKRYYQLRSKKSTTIRLKGPGVLLVQSRTRLKKKSDRLSYEYSYSVNQGLPQQLSFKKVAPSKTDKYKRLNKYLPSTKETTRIPLGRGEHSIRFKKISANQIDLRFVFISKKGKRQKWVNFEPHTTNNSQDVIIKESKETYFKLDKKKPISITIVGPTTLRVLSRLIRSYEDKGRSRYKISVKQNKILKNTYQLSSKKSHLAQLHPKSSFTLSKAKEISIDVPSGKHTYEFKLKSPKNKTALMRFLLPENEVLQIAQKAKE